MKTLRLLRNIAALFILMMALLAMWPGVGIAHADGKGCLIKKGFNCLIGVNGGCTEQACKGGLCTDTGCRHFSPF